jgi:hypothetical protein
LEKLEEALKSNPGFDQMKVISQSLNENPGFPVESNLLNMHL